MAIGYRLETNLRIEIIYNGLCPYFEIV